MLAFTGLSCVCELFFSYQRLCLTLGRSPLEWLLRSNFVLCLRGLACKLIHLTVYVLFSLSFLRSSNNPLLNQLKVGQFARGMARLLLLTLRRSKLLFSGVSTTWYLNRTWLCLMSILFLSMWFWVLLHETLRVLSMLKKFKEPSLPNSGSQASLSLQNTTRTTEKTGAEPDSIARFQRRMLRRYPRTVLTFRRIYSTTNLLASFLAGMTPRNAARLGRKLYSTVSSLGSRIFLRSRTN